MKVEEVSAIPSLNALRERKTKKQIVQEARLDIPNGEGKPPFPRCFLSLLFPLWDWHWSKETDLSLATGHGTALTHDSPTLTNPNPELLLRNPQSQHKKSAFYTHTQVMTAKVIMLDACGFPWRF